MECSPDHPMEGHRPTLTCSIQVTTVGPPPCPLRPAEGSSALPCSIGQRGGRGGAGLPGQPARMCWVGHDCIVGREAGAPQGRTPAPSAAPQPLPAAHPSKQEPGLARVRGAGASRSGGHHLSVCWDLGEARGLQGQVALLGQRPSGATTSPAMTPPDA